MRQKGDRNITRKIKKERRKGNSKREGNREGVFGVSGRITLLATSFIGRHS